jgi:hypothetical protein
VTEICMFEFIKNLFVDNNIPSISFLEFYRKVSRLKQENLFPYEYNLPQAIALPESFWKEVTAIHKMTLGDGLEREISLFQADGDLIFTSVVKGSENSVKSGHSITVKYVPHPTRKGYLRKEIYMDGSIYKRLDVYYKNAPKKVSVEYLFNLHTHPKYVNEVLTSAFSFVSKQDIVSQLQSQAIVSGLVTDKLWLFVRTNNTPPYINLEEPEINVKTLSTDMKMVVYCAEFFKKAIRQ